MAGYPAMDSLTVIFNFNAQPLAIRFIQSDECQHFCPGYEYEPAWQLSGYSEEQEQKMESTFDT